MASSHQEKRKLEVFGSVSDLGPPDLLEFLEQCAGLLPEEIRFRLKETLSSFPPEGDSLQRVLEVVRKQWEGLQSKEWLNVAVVGPARTGKRTLVGNLMARKQPGTRSIFSLVDTQGLDEYLGYGQTNLFPEEIHSSDILLLVLDAEYKFNEATLQLVQRFSRLGKAFLVVLNKIDLVERPRQVIKEAKKLFGTPVIPVSANHPETLSRLLRAMVSVFPRAVYPLASNFAGFRKNICRGIVSQAAFGAGLTGAVPIPISDILPISAIQVGMILKLARVFGFRIDRGRARELLPVLAVGGLVREGTHRLRQMFPQHERLIAISTASLWTYLIGQAAILYFERLGDMGTVEA